MKTADHHSIRYVEKSDEDLAREWMSLEKGINNWISLTPEDDENKRFTIEKELGKERLEFLVFKIETEERLKKLESQQDDKENLKRMTTACIAGSNSYVNTKVETECDIADHSNDDFLVTGVNTQDGSFVGRFTQINTWQPWYKRLLDWHRENEHALCSLLHMFVLLFAIFTLITFTGFVIYLAATNQIQ